MKRMTQRKGEKNERDSQRFYERRSGYTVEIILIIVVLIGLVIIFKKQLNDLVKKVFQKISSDSNSIISAAGSRKC